jgi:hypothetical protein
LSDINDNPNISGAREFLRDYVASSHQEIDSWLSGASRETFGAELILLSLMGYVIESFNFLSGPIMNTDLTVAVSFGVLPSGKYASLGSMSKALETTRFVSPIIGISLYGRQICAC